MRSRCLFSFLKWNVITVKLASDGKIGSETGPPCFLKLIYVMFLLYLPSEFHLCRHLFYVLCFNWRQSDINFKMFSSNPLMFILWPSICKSCLYGIVAHEELTLKQFRFVFFFNITASFIMLLCCFNHFDSFGFLLYKRISKFKICLPLLYRFSIWQYGCIAI